MEVGVGLGMNCGRAIAPNAKAVSSIKTISNMGIFAGNAYFRKGSNGE